VIARNEAEFTKSNILKWRSEGYTGKGVNIVVLDDNGATYPKDNIIEPLLHLDRSIYKAGHKGQVCSVIREVLPNANIYAFNWFSDYKDEINKWIIEHADMIDVINCSFSTTSSGYNSLMELKDLNIPFTVAVGNEATPYGNLTSSLEFAFGIGMWGQEQDRKSVRSNYGLHLDFMAFTGIYYVSETSGREVQFYGTSCSAPYTAGIIGVYAELFRSINNRPMTRQECFEFLLKSLDDKDEIGRDDNSGYGLVKLPNEIPTIEKEEPKVIFEDTKNHWSKEVVDAVSEAGIMTGYADGTFKPDKAITRGEMASVVYKLMKDFLK